MIRRGPARAPTQIRVVLATLLTGVALALVAGPAGAQAASCLAAIAEPRAWTAPLDRRVSLSARSITTREAIDRIAAAARFRISYSGEFVPVERALCVSVDSAAAGDILAAILGSQVAPVPTGAEQVVLAPGRPLPARLAPVPILEQVVVTGTATADARRGLSISADVIDGRALQQRGATTLSSTFDGNAPGIWMWEQSPTSPIARYGSVRGASSFNLSYPKIYIDGIEVANPLLMTEINPAIIDRVEVIRGPQGAALYGADAIAGVVIITTRHGGLATGSPRTEVSSAGGFVASDYTSGAALSQRHGVSWRTGTSLRSASAGATVTSLGGFLPGAFSRDVKLDAGGKLVTSFASFTGTARLYAKSSAAGLNPILNPPATAGESSAADGPIVFTGPEPSRLASFDTVPRSVREFTVGGTTTLLTGRAWTPSLTVGLDGYRLSNIPGEMSSIPTPMDSALFDARGGADRGSARLTLVRDLKLPGGETVAITLAAEHAALRQTISEVAMIGDDGSEAILRDVVNWQSNTGLVAQGTVAYGNFLYVTSGLRFERSDGFSVENRNVMLPMLGLAAIRDGNWGSVKFRAAYGIGIRPANATTREMGLHDVRRFGIMRGLDPEEQSGTEIGGDITIGRRLTLKVTRFDQNATGLVQPVAIPSDDVINRRLMYVLQNVGEIANHGWELSSTLGVGPLTLGGALSTVESRVKRIAPGYTGDLASGDRMLGVPARTGSLSATWARPSWQASMSLSRAYDWMNYDRLALARAFAECGTCDAEDVTGPQLRSFWRRYEGVTRVRASVSRELTRVLTLRLTGDNLTNAQRGEPDNITILPGRSLMLGLSAGIR